MDSFAGNNEDTQSLHKYLYGEDDPIDNNDSSGNDIGETLDVMDFSVMLDNIGFPVAAQAKNLALQVTGKYVDVYVWDHALRGYASVGHVMCTEHGSRNVILSQFPFIQTGGKEKEGTYLPGWGLNRTQDFGATFASEKRQPNHEYTILVPDPLDFYATAASQRHASLWDCSPIFPTQTQCSTAVWLSLEAGKVTFEPGQVYSFCGGTLLPNTVDEWLEKDSTQSATTGVKQDF
jgi:hypothetical protein